ncbi:MAG: Gfo/Idh/MocA family protein [Candidatus Bipolaricaulia bacterium]
MPAHAHYRIGIAGLVHDHVWGLLPDFQKTGGAELVAAADPHEPLRAKIAQNFGIEDLYENYGQMLDDKQLDIVLVCTSNAGATPVVEAAAQRGIHAIVEKPMAANLEQADRMLQAAEEAGIRLMINWPTAWMPAIRYVYRLAEQGDLGEVHRIRYFGGHSGPKEIGCSPYFYNWLYDEEQNGGGASLDYGGYGASLCRWFLGVPESVIGVATRLVKDYIDVDDNASLILRYPRALGLCDATWTQVGQQPLGLIVNGTQATAIIGPDGVLLASQDEPGGRQVTPPPLPLGEHNGPAYFLTCLRDDRPLEGLVNPRISRDAAEIVEAGVRSAKSGEAVKLPLKGGF